MTAKPVAHLLANSGSPSRTAGPMSATRIHIPNHNSGPSSTDPTSTTDKPKRSEIDVVPSSSMPTPSTPNASFARSTLHRPFGRHVDQPTEGESYRLFKSVNNLSRKG
jgi:hypothetical protein